MFGSGIVLWGLYIGLRPLHDNSFLTHLATGRLIWSTGGIPRVDPYSFTAAGEPWVVQSWLASLIYGAADAVAGLGGVRVLHGLLVGALSGLVWHLTRPAAVGRSLSIGRTRIGDSRIGVVPVGRQLITATVVIMGIEEWVERPLLFGLLGLALLLVLVNGEADLRWCLPVMWVWVNTHGSFPLALVLIGGLAAGRCFDGERPVRELRALAWVAVGTLLAGVNPLGPRLLVFPFSLASRSEAFRMIEEWRPPTYAPLSQRLFLLLVAVTVIVLIRRFRWRDLLVSGVFVALALTSARNVVVATVVLVPVIANLPLGIRATQHTSRHPKPDGTSKSIHVGAVAAFVLAGALLVTSALRQPDTRLDAYPVAAVSWLDQRSLLDRHLVAPDYVGNYLEFRGSAEPSRRRVFIDDRVDMYPLPVVRDVGTLMHGDPGWETVLRRHGAGAVLWQKDDRLADLLAASPAWRRAWSDPLWVVYLPR